jgi:putative phosphoribosyl transferase
MSAVIFEDREDAGRRLAERLLDLIGVEEFVILALPRGGVPVAAVLAKALERPFDVLLVRKLGVPGHEEFAMGAIASDGVKVLSEDVISQLRLSAGQVDEVVRRETAELVRRERLYRRGRASPEVVGRTVVVDDGIATGSTMFAAIELLRARHARRIIVAVPVAAPDTVARMRGKADAVVTVMEPAPFHAVGRWYESFGQITDEEVRALLEGMGMEE